MEPLEGNRHVIIIITEAEWKRFTHLLEEFKEKLEYVAAPLQNSRAGPIVPGYIPAMEFMAAVRISRSYMDELIRQNKIETIKKARKIYVLATEVNRFFTDPSIQ